MGYFKLYNALLDLRKVVISACFKCDNLHQV
jgi:hypothetical protein